MHFRHFPQKVRWGISFLISAWAFLTISQAMYHGSISLVQLTIGSFCCIVVYSLKNWGRIFCVIYNVLLIGNSIYMVYNFSRENLFSPIPFGIHAFNIVLFVTATYFLVTNETTRFFKSHSKALNTTSGEDGTEASP